MIPNITRGRRIAGLLVYLAGPGRANEHTEPHLVAGDSAIMAWHDDAELNRDAALESPGASITPAARSIPTWQVAPCGIAR